MTSVLIARTANHGGEAHFMQRFGTTGTEGSRTWSGRSLSTDAFADLVAKAAEHVDFVCVDETGLGGALVDMLKQRGITALTSRRAAAFE